MLRSFETDMDILGAEQMAARQRERYDFGAHEEVEGEAVVGTTTTHPELEELARRARIQTIPSVVKRVALEAYIEMDAMFTSISRKALS